MSATTFSLSPTRLLTATLCVLSLSACSPGEKSPEASLRSQIIDTTIRSNWFPTTQAAETLSWPNAKTSVASPGTQVVAFADHMQHPRWLYALPNGDILVAETPEQPVRHTFNLKSWISRKMTSSHDAATDNTHYITLLRDEDGDGIAEERHVFIKDIPAPAGIALIDDAVFIASEHTLLKFAYQPGQVAITQAPESIPTMTVEKPLQKPVELLTELSREDSTNATQPATVLLNKHGHLLVADDAGNVIWHVKGNRKIAQQ